jgi:anti-anti-sigma regulatory factor
MLTSIRHGATGVTVLRLAGVLDVRSYPQVRDSVMKAALDAGSALIVDVDELEARDDHVWTVFTSARWDNQQWPDIPIALVSADPVVRRRLRDYLSVARYLPVYSSVATAADAIGDGDCRHRHLACEQFGPHAHSVNAALMFVRDHLVAWSMRDKIAVASTVTTVFAENALCYTSGGFDIRLEVTTDEVVVAVSDASPTLAVRRERPLGGCLAGLDIVSALCHRWGNTPTSTGKTVWASIGADDAFAGITGRLQRAGHAAS